jgi:hypothetical protein
VIVIKIEKIYGNNRLPTEIEINPFWTNEECDFMRRLVFDIKNENWDNVSVEKIETGQALLLKGLKSIIKDVADNYPEGCENE